MRHARSDYDRIQDPAANRELLDAFDNAMRTLANGVRHGVRDVSIADYMQLFRALSRLTQRLHPQLGALANGDMVVEHPIADDEPVFLLRARDRTAPATVEYWAVAQGEHSLMTAAAQRIVRDMIAWQEKYGCKAADAPVSALR